MFNDLKLTNFSKMAVPRADNTHASLVKFLRDFQERLDPSKEVGVMLARFGDKIFHVERIGFYEPNLLWMGGTLDDGRDAELILHHTQAQLVFLAVDPTPGRSARRIGFQQEG